MTPNFNDLRVAEEHRRDLLREAAQIRHDRQIAALLRPERAGRRPFYAPALARLGRTLVSWGARLQGLEQV